MQLHFVLFWVALHLNNLAQRDFQRTVLQVRQTLQDVGLVDPCELLPTLVVLAQQFAELICARNFWRLLGQVTPLLRNLVLHVGRRGRRLSMPRFLSPLVLLASLRKL
jgi:hypothetical protein